MMQQDVKLQSYNTFGFPISCQLFATIKTEQDFLSLRDSPAFQQKKMILGGGSNVLFTHDFDGLIIWNQLKGIEKIKEDEHNIWLKVGAGEVWHDFVMYCVNNDIGGIENLSLIPGYVGAAPMQNIGAYGTETKDVCESVSFIDFEHGKTQQLNAAACQFDYRESIFKQELKEKVFITSVTFKFSKKHEVNTKYGAIEEELALLNITHPSIKQVSDAVIKIRSNKLPDPKKLGNAGSFFKNPIVSEQLAATLKQNHPNIPCYPVPQGAKLAAGWLIEQAGWKGHTSGYVGVHQKQALVLVNYGGGVGNDILTLSEQIQADVFKKFGVTLEREVNLVG
jgi:UDP-N-acetylmuramate dehydrogenase